VDPASLLPGVLPVARTEDDDLVAEVLWVDRYGNAQLNVDPDELDGLAGEGEPVEVAFADTTRVASRADAYGMLPVGSVGLVVDSYGLVSVAVDRGSAAGELGLTPGTEVRLRAVGDDDDGPSGVTVSLGEPRRKP